MFIENHKINFEKVIGTNTQIKILYRLLKVRNYNISNKNIPRLKEHIEFVINHPYRIWYLIKIDLDYIGSIYILKNNCIGINLIKNIDSFSEIIKLILKKYKPLKEIKSVRPPFFFINVAPGNVKIHHQLKNMRADKIQTTYLIK